jgi:hypothetical protein
MNAERGCGCLGVVAVAGLILLGLVDFRTVYRADPRNLLVPWDHIATLDRQIRSKAELGETRGPFKQGPVTSGPLKRGALWLVCTKAGQLHLAFLHRIPGPSELRENFSIGHQVEARVRSSLPGTLSKQLTIVAMGRADTFVSTELTTADVKTIMGWFDKGRPQKYSVSFQEYGFYFRGLADQQQAVKTVASCG